LFFIPRLRLSRFFCLLSCPFPRLPASFVLPSLFSGLPSLLLSSSDFFFLARIKA
jgi:hypothetical protein